MSGIDILLEPELWYKNNVTTTTRIQRICNKNKIPLVYASSSCVHAWWKSPYGTTKKINEETAFPGQVGLRFTTVYGEGARDSMFIGKLLRKEIKYATNHTRDFIHVSDVVEGIMLFINGGLKSWSSKVLLPAYNMGTGKGNKVFEVAHAFGWLGVISLTQQVLKQFYLPNQTTEEIQTMNTKLYLPKNWVVRGKAI